jgi:hypothetical protein
MVRCRGILLSGGGGPAAGKGLVFFAPAQKKT